jgi:autotransporter-associated beta strand protein
VFAPHALGHRRSLPFGLILAAGTIAVVLLAGTAHAVIFRFDYSGDSPGEGFNDPVLGESRRAALQFAGDIWGDLIRPTFLNETILVRAVYDPVADLTRDVYASASPNGFIANFGSSSPQYLIDTNFPTPLANHLYGDDSLPNVTDINISFNANVGVAGILAANSFYLGTDASPGASQIDFVTVALHEIGHGLGFFETVRQDGSYGVNAEGEYDPDEETTGSPSIYDRLITAAPTPLLSLSQSGRAGALVSNSLFWNGANGAAGNMGASPKLFAPNPYDDGSSVSHVDPAAHRNELMVPGLAPGAAIHAPGPVDRGMLRDMGWTISVAARNVTWTGAGPNNAARTAANWSPNLPLPGDNLVFGNSPQTDVNFDLEIESMGSLTFNVAAPSYTLRMRAWTDTAIDGGGVINNSGNPQTIILESNDGSSPSSVAAAGAKLTFNNSATAGIVTYEVRGGASIPHPPLVYDRFRGASVEFNDNATALTARFNVEGASGNGAPGTYGHVDFRDNSSANNAEFWNKGGRIGGDFGGVSVSGFGGQTNFHDNASADFATFRNDGEAEYFGGTGGITTFRDNSTAGNGVFVNNGGSIDNGPGGNGGATQFTGNSTAANSNITNNGGMSIYGKGGQTTFSEDSTAGSATITNAAPTGVPGYAGRTLFFGSASGGSAVITNMPSLDSRITTTDFYGTSTAAGATIINLSGPGSTIAGTTTFHDSSSAGNGTFINDSATAGRGSFIFKDSSTAGQGTFTNGDFGGVITFHNNSTAGTANISLRGRSNTVMQFFDDTSASAATIDIGRLVLGPTNESNDVQFYGRSTAANSTITARGDGGRVSFAGNFNPGGIPSTTAGNATIVALGSTRPGNISGTIGGQVQFNTWSTAGNATITAQGATVAGAPGGIILFHNGGHAGNATLIANGGASAENGGLIRFQSAGTGDSARLVVNAGAFADVSNNAFHGGTAVGSIEGAGKFSIGGSLLTVGSLNTNATVSGTITDSGGLSPGVGGMLTKVGTGALTLSGANTYTGLTTVDEGTLVVNGSIAGGAVVKDGGVLKGSGSMGSVLVETGGLFSPGLSPGTITVGGLNFMSGSTLEYELGAIARDRIVLTTSGNVTLGGVLDLFLVDGFKPSLGQTFSLFEGAIGSITGAFSEVNAPTFNGHTLNVLYGVNQVMLQVGEANFLAADFTEDGGVDSDDLARWRANFGAGRTHKQGDADGNGAVDGADLLIWQQQLGSGLVASTSMTVPEPSALALTILAMGGWYDRRLRSVLKKCEQLINA